MGDDHAAAAFNVSQLWSRCLQAGLNQAVQEKPAYHVATPDQSSAFLLIQNSSSLRRLLDLAGLYGLDSWFGNLLADKGTLQRQRCLGWIPLFQLSVICWNTEERWADVKGKEFSRRDLVTMRDWLKQQRT